MDTSFPTAKIQIAIKIGSKTKFTDLDSDFSIIIIFFIPILVVGIVSGLELPLLMKIRNKMEEKFYVLGFDFVGMFVASLLFPISFFTLGLFKTATTISIINLLVTYRLSPSKEFGKEKLIVIFLLLIAIFLWLFDKRYLQKSYGGERHLPSMAPDSSPLTKQQERALEVPNKEKK